MKRAEHSIIKKEEIIHGKAHAIIMLVKILFEYTVCSVVEVHHVVIPKT